MSEWKDISSAPKDGTEVLLFIPGTPARTALGAWRATSSWQNGIKALADPDWHGLGISGPPSHFMPLPSPPHTSREKVE